MGPGPLEPSSGSVPACTGIFTTIGLESTGIDQPVVAVTKSGAVRRCPIEVIFETAREKK